MNVTQFSGDTGMKTIDSYIHQMYLDFKNDINNFSYWYPKIANCGISTPKSVWLTVPEDVMNCFHYENKSDEVGIQRFVEKSVISTLSTFLPSNQSELFMKNGTYSNKFNFETCHITTLSSCEITYKLSLLSYESLLKDAGGNTELVFREFIRDKWSVEQTQYSIYNGMLLKPEIRIFYDFDKRRVLYAVNYWDYDYCYNTIVQNNITDGLVFKAAYPALLNRVNQDKDSLLRLVDSHMKNVDLTGRWSIDFMYCKDIWWLIDMATAETSAYWNPDRIL